MGEYRNNLYNIPIRTTQVVVQRDGARQRELRCTVATQYVRTVRPKTYTNLLWGVRILQNLQGRLEVDWNGFNGNGLRHCAGTGTASRRGVGKVRRLRTQAFWIQQQLADELLDPVKETGEDNIADLLSKHVDARTVQRHLRAMGSSHVL